MATAEPVGFQERSIRRFFEASLLAMLLSGYGAMLSSEGLQSGALDVVSTAAAGCVLLARLWMVVADVNVEIPARYVNWITLLYMVFYPLDYLYVSSDFLRATLHLVYFISIVKVMTASRPRDYFLLKIIAFLEMLAASVLSVNLSFLIFLVLFLCATVATLASAEIVRACERRHLVTRGAGAFGRRLGRLTALTTLAILVVTSALFFVLPRTARAALERLLPPVHRTSGFSSEVTLGQVGEIRLQGTAVLHVRFESGFQPVNLRWRGVALSEFNGLKWYNSTRNGKLLRPDDKGWLALVDDDERRRAGRRITYQAILNHTGTDWLFLAGRVEQLHVPSSLVVVETPAAGYRVPFMEPEDLRYEASATLGEPGASRAKMREDDRNFHLRLPPLDPRVMALAQTITAGAKNDYERARAIERYLRTDFRYSLEPLEHEVDDPLAHFLFVSKKGHCEYFASAMGVLLRAVWVPSRVVTGFQSGTFNPLSGWHVVRASDAHSWVEAWVPGEGWLTFDPTPSDPGGGATALSRLGLWADAASVFWQEWVLGYDLDRQLTLAFEVDRQRRGVSLDWAGRLNARLRSLWQGDWRAAASHWSPWLLAVPIVLILILLGPWMRARMLEWLRLRRLRQGQPAPDDASLIYRQMLGELRRRGFVKPDSATPAEFARGLQPAATASAVGEFTELYYALRFGDRRENAARMAELLDRIEQLP